MSKEKMESMKILKLAAVVLVGILLLGFIYDLVLRKDVVEDCQQKFRENVKEASVSVSEKITQRKVLLESAAQMLTIDDGEFSESDIAILTVAQNGLRAYLTGVAFSDGKVILSNKDQYESNIVKEWTRIKKDEVFIHRLSVGDGFGTDGVVFGVPKYDKSGKVTGLVFAILDDDEGRNILSMRIYNNTGFCYLVDKEGKLLFLPEKRSSSDYDLNVINAMTVEWNAESYREAHEDENSLRVVKAPGGLRYVTCAVNTSINNDAVLICMAPYALVYEKKNIVDIALTALSGAAIVMMVVVTLSVMNEKKHIEQGIKRATEKDPLTGLPSKSKHIEKAEKLLGQTKTRYAYAVFDINNFKYINENNGYEYGNIVLRYVSRVLRNSLDRDELVSRTSGDHFGTLIKFKNAKALENRLSAILEKASHVPSTDKLVIRPLVFSCGAYVLAPGEKNMHMIRSRANIAKRSIKKTVYSQIAFYSEVDLRNEIEMKALENDLQPAMENKEFLIYLQPKYSISTEKIIGAEALVRWQHPERGLIMPGYFIPMCEENGFVKKIDFFMLEEVCKIVKRWQDEGKEPVKISVNFSRVHLNDEGFVDHLINVVKENGVEPKNIEIELTETGEYNQIDKLLDVMKTVKGAGFGLSMDDFGSGYSSLQLLAAMPVDVLKLDKGFMDRCNENEGEKEKSIVSHVIAMAKDLDIEVLAEGVETAEQKNFLRNVHCDTIQGYYYAKPMPVAEFEKYITE
ncbi:MAG: EAL domain-containing protein [Lachnospiraceae bacterium]|nr:EAL domain-containing protein [Lachnospiraceae bacterium]